MDQIALDRLAEAISGRMVAQPAYWIAFLVAGLAGFFAAHITAYMRRKGENLATKEDFAELLTQLQATTQATEEIRTKIGADDWTKREYKRIRREKLEQLLQLVIEIDAWVQTARRHYVFSATEEPGRSPDARAKALQRLYFPELKAVINAFGLKVGELHILYMECGMRMSRHPDKGEQLAVVKEFEEAINQKQKELIDCRGAVELAIEALSPSLYE